MGITGEARGTFPIFPYRQQICRSRSRDFEAWAAFPRVPVYGIVTSLQGENSMNKHIDQNVDQTAIDLYDDFTHGHISRRDFFDRLTSLAGSAGAATAIYTSLRSDYAQAAIVAPDDARLISEKITFDTPNGKVSGTLVRLKDKAKRPAVIAIHENRGLNPHIEDVARRFALDGYLAFAIDLLSSQGGTPSDERQGPRDVRQDQHRGGPSSRRPVVVTRARQASGVHRQGRHRRLLLGRRHGQSRCVDRAGRSLARRSPITAALRRDKDRIPNIKAPLLLHYAGLDGNINPGHPGL